MSPGIVSLLSVTVGFSVLVVWVYWPSHKARMERYASIPLTDEPEAPASQPALQPTSQKEQSK